MESSKVWIIVVVVLLAACLCLCGICLLGGFAFYKFGSATPIISIPTLSEQNTGIPTNPFTQATHLPQPSATVAPEASATPEPQATPDSAAFQTLSDLDAANVPIGDPVDLIGRLEGVHNIPQTLPFPGIFKVGDQQKFWVSDNDTSVNRQATATLQYVTDHAYFWVENGITFNQQDLADLANTFNDKIYPTDREFFGSEWNPGIDNDPRIYILYTHGLGNNIAAYFSSIDSVPPQANPYSNGHEMFLINANSTSLDSDYTKGVLAHEFQHMIHWNLDRNEEGWMNEGFSELAAFLNGYDTGGFDSLFSADPDIQLNDWPNNSSATSPHYGSSFLFLTYFLDRFGENATKAVVASPENGLESIDTVLSSLNETNSVTSKPITADDVFADWAVANYLDDPSLLDGRYAYHNYPALPAFGDTEQVVNCQGETESHTVHQYGTDYIHFLCPGDFTINFQGSGVVKVIPEGAHSGNFAFWSNKGDESDMTFTHTFDLTKATGDISMDYYTWYDLEKDYDYLYLDASTDNGQSWQILTTPNCTTDNPSGNSYGCGYNGQSGGYIEQNVDLSQFAGKTVELRFEYVTDAAVNGEGLLLDDVSIPAIGYSTDFETDDGGWQADGFVRIDNELPQTYRVSLIHLADPISVDTYTVDPAQSLSLDVHLSSSQDSAILVVSGTTRFTRQPAPYTFSATVDYQGSSSS